MKQLKQLVQASLASLGYRLVKLRDYSYDPISNLDSFFSILNERQFAPKHIVDVGANRGVWTRRTAGG